MAFKTRGSAGRTVKPGGDIVASTAGEFRKKLMRLTGRGVKELTIDLKGVNTLDAVGLWVLIAAHNSLERSGGMLKIKNPSEGIFRLLTNLKLDQTFEVIAV
ncbi:MAG: STAS domain-containing protein [Deltaproteobacteria bacterium]|nr:STAS domain-containing protein [Deltaproteobacteria bacterium]